MKVGLVLDRFDPRRGGLEVWATSFAAALVEGGHEVHVLAFEIADTALVERLVLHRLEGSASRLARADRVHARLETLDLDVVHDCGVGWRCDVLHLHAGARREALARSCAVLPRWRRPLARLRRRASRNVRDMLQIEAAQMAHDASLVVLPSRQARAELERRYPAARARLRVVANGVDTARFSPVLRDAHRERLRLELGARDGTLFLSVARNPFLKGVPTTIRALASLRREGYAATLAVVGGRDVAALRLHARALGVESAVSLLGPIDDPAPYYAAADAFVHPTLRDSCSLVVLEACASGLAVAGSRCDGSSELLEGSGASFTLDDPEDWRALAAILRRLCDRATREAAGRAAREAALGLGFDAHVAAMLDVYRESRERRPR